ncbi:hypothetical protein OG21DRAFT_624161 [Imleria badia]|nr:hypothetical protein OG21DRAFT_624161 [Imleria badia]
MRSHGVAFSCPLSTGKVSLPSVLLGLYAVTCELNPRAKHLVGFYRKLLRSCSFLAVWCTSTASSYPIKYPNISFCRL